MKKYIVKTVTMALFGALLTACGGEMPLEQEGIEISTSDQAISICNDEPGLWAAANDLAGAIPVGGTAVKLFTALSKIAQRANCPSTSQLMVEDVERIAQATVNNTLLVTLRNNIVALNNSIEQNQNPTADNLDGYATTAQQRESDAINLGFPALTLQASLASTKYGLFIGKYHKEVAFADKLNAIHQAVNGARYSLNQFAVQEQKLETHIAGVAAEVERVPGGLFPGRRGYAYIGHRRIYGQIYDCTGRPTTGFDCRNATGRARQDANQLRPQLQNTIRNEVIHADYRNIKAKLTNAVRNNGNLCTLQNYWVRSEYLNVQSGSLASSPLWTEDPLNPIYDAQLWHFEPVPGTNRVWISAIEGYDKRLNTEPGNLQLSSIWNTAHSGQWVLEAVPNHPNVYQIRNYWTSSLLNREYGILTVGNVHPGAHSAWWIFNPECTFTSP